MENNKQTAVEWLEDRLENLLELYASEWDKVSNVINQTKAMEENQHLQTFKAGQESMEEGGKNFEQYFNETYAK